MPFSTSQSRPPAKPASPAADALRSLRRAIATVRSYPTGNELTERAFGDLEAHFARVLPLRLVVAPEDLLEADGTPLDIDEGLRHLVRELHRDGVRALYVETGMARPELDRFVAALAAPRDVLDLSEDTVTRLWEAELPHVVVRALDPYLERQLPGDVLEGKARPSGEVEGIEGEALTPTPPPPEEAFRLGEEDRAKLDAERRRATAESAWPSFTRALRETLDSSVGARRPDELRRVVEATLFRLVAEGQLGLARDLAREARARASAGASDWQAVLERASHPERLEGLLPALERGLGSEPVVAELLVALGGTSAAAAEQLLCRASTPAARRALADALGALGEGGRARLVALLSHGGDAVALTAAHVLAATGERRQAEPILRAFERAVRPTRRELLRAAAAVLHGPERERLVTVATCDPDEDCRLFALGELARAPLTALREPVLARIRSRAYADLVEGEKDALFRALASAGGPAAVAFLESVVAGGGLGRGDSADRMRAARALAREGSEQALAVLQERARGHAPGAEFCRLALRGAA